MSCGKQYKCIYKSCSTCVSANHHTPHCMQSRVDHGYSLGRHNLHCQRTVNYLAVPASLSLRSKLAGCLPVFKVSAGCLPTMESVVYVALYRLVRHSSPLEKSLTQQQAFVGKSLTQQEALVSNFCIKGACVPPVSRAKYFAVMQLAVYALTTLTPMLLHVPATDLQIASMDMSGTSCCFC